MKSKILLPFCLLLMVTIIFSSCSNVYQYRLVKRDHTPEKSIQKLNTTATRELNEAGNELGILQTLETPLSVTPINTNEKLTKVKNKSIANQTLAFAKQELKKEVRQQVKKSNVLRERNQQEEQKANDDKILYIILAIFIPFLAVALYEKEITSHFWIALLLTFLFLLPGIIYAIVIIAG